MLVLVTAGTARADDDRRGHGRHDNRHDGRHYDRDDRWRGNDWNRKSWNYRPHNSHNYSYYYYGPRTAGAPVVFIDRDRTVIHRYVGGHYRPQPVYREVVVKRPYYVVGRPVPQGIIVSRVPDDLLGQLNPPPLGHYYGMVDRDVLLISAASHNVIDAVTYFSAVGN